MKDFSFQHMMAEASLGAALRCDLSTDGLQYVENEGTGRYGERVRYV